jgi:hypothetical protein
MKPADFEESEFRGPLYNQLERGSHLVWEPGQVFEKHIGIDRAAFVTDPSFWGIHGRTTPMPGLFLLDFEWNSMWKARLKGKALPDFELNLFLQAKRSYAGTRPNGKLRKAGITNDYWKFEVTPHQQDSLQQLSKALSGKALVCYASPAFHTQAALYEHTKNQSIVSASTFPPACNLAGHAAWYYNKGGNFGIPNPDFVRIAVEPLHERIKTLVGSSPRKELNAAMTLKNLAEQLLQSTSAKGAPAATDTWFQMLLYRVDDTIEMMRALGGRDEGLLAATRHFGQVRAFCNAYRLDWYVLGSGV